MFKQIKQTWGTIKKTSSTHQKMAKQIEKRMARLKPHEFLSPQSSAAVLISLASISSLSTRKQEKEKKGVAMVTEHQAQPLFNTRPTFLTSAAYVPRPSLCFRSSLYLYVK